VGDNEDGEKPKKRKSPNGWDERRPIDFRGGKHGAKLSRKQQITQLSCDSMCETDDETAEGGGGKDSIAPSEG
jgi:hypothetical protein